MQYLLDSNLLRGPSVIHPDSEVGCFEYLFDLFDLPAISDQFSHQELVELLYCGGGLACTLGILRSLENSGEQLQFASVGQLAKVSNMLTAVFSLK